MSYAKAYTTGLINWYRRRHCHHHHHYHRHYHLHRVNKFRIFYAPSYMANFAKAQLSKYGWKEGKGLGKNEDGITEPLRSTLKFDTTGIGYKNITVDEWWKTMFDNAIKNITIESHDDRLSLSVVGDNYDTVLSEGKKDKKQLKYGNFLKTSILRNGHLIDDQNTSMKQEQIGETVRDTVHIPLTDTDVLIACDNKTVHKGVRYSLALNEKLNRLATQDTILLDANTSTAVYRSNVNPIGENIVGHRNIDVKLDIEEDVYEIDSNIKALQSEAKNPVVRSKRHKKKMRHLMRQLSICNIKENKRNDKESEYYSLNDKRLCQTGKKNKKKRANSNASKDNLKRIINKTRNEFCQFIPLLHDNYTSREKNNSKKETQNHKAARNRHFDVSDKVESKLVNSNKINERVKNQDEQECTTIVIQIEANDTYLSKSKRSNESYDKNTINRSICMNDRVRCVYSDEEMYKVVSMREKEIYCGRNSTKDEIDLLTCLSNVTDSTNVDLDRCVKNLMVVKKLSNKMRKNKKQRSMKKLAKMEEIIKKLLDKHNEHNLDVIIKGLTDVILTDDVSIALKKKKPTQTHLTPV